MTLRSYSLAIVAAVNNDKVLCDNLAMSPMISEDRVPLIAERGHQSVAKAYNAGLDKVTADIVIFARQDDYLPRGWDKKMPIGTTIVPITKSGWSLLRKLVSQRRRYYFRRATIRKGYTDRIDWSTYNFPNPNLLPSKASSTKVRRKYLKAKILLRSRLDRGLYRLIR